MANRLRFKKNNIDSWVDAYWPVGSIYMSVNATNPSTYFGGTWQKISTGRVLMGTSNNSQLGTTVDSGLPNISGYVDPRWVDHSGGGTMMYIQNNGPFYTTKAGSVWWSQATTTDGQGDYTNRIHFDASRANAIYGRSSIVQPPAFYCYIWKRVS